MKILNLDPHKYSNEARLILSSFDYSEKKITRSKLLKIVHNYDVLVLRFSHKIDKQIIDKAKRLKLVATNATGTNHLDSKYLKKKKIKILSLQGNEKFMKKITASAEHTWGLVLALIRHIPQGYNDVLSNRWDREKYVGEQLYGKNLGIIGYGRNGKKISKIASSFGMKVFFF